MDGVTYLDHAATTPLRPEALAAMTPYLTQAYGNPSGLHAMARQAKTAVEAAREDVADCLGCAPGEVIFTGGGTEADNLAVMGAAYAAAGAEIRGVGIRGAVVTTAFEHKGVLAPMERLAAEGFPTRIVGVTPAGIVDLDQLAAALDPETVVVSVMLVNNEVGTMQPFDAVADLVRERAPRARLHTDAVQAVPWVPVHELAAGADLISISAHKFGGPKGTGVLVVREGTALEPRVIGGGQERGLRSGTVNVAGVVGLAAALRITHNTRGATVARVAALRDAFAVGLRAVGGVIEHGDRNCAVAGNHHVRVPGIEAETLLVALDRYGVCAAAGSSCSSGAAEPSHVLAAMGLTREEAREAVRFSFGFASTSADVARALDIVPRVIDDLRRAGSPKPAPVGAR